MGTKKRTKWVELIFEVEKLKIFQLQKLIQPERTPLMHAFCTQHKQCVGSAKVELILKN
jgi:hypothetical protein